MHIAKPTYPMVSHTALSAYDGIDMEDSSLYKSAKFVDLCLILRTHIGVP